jgi:hypothetical protein
MHIDYKIWLIGLIFLLSAGTLKAEIEITTENWTEVVAFAPDAKALKLKKGLKISKKNLAEHKAWIPDAMQMLIEKYNLVIKLTSYQPVVPSESYVAATQENCDKCQLSDVGKAVNKRGLKGYVAGLPFVQPKTGLEVAWNFHYAYGGDDAEVTYSVYWISAASGVEHSEEWRLSRILGTGRTDLEPLPDIQSFKDKGIQGAGLTYAIAPYDKKGFGAVYFRSTEPKDGQGHTYVPSMRRILKHSFGTRGDTWNGTDLLYEDVRGYSGYPEWMNWKLVAKKTVLLPMHAGVKLGKKSVDKAYKFKKAPHWNPNYRYEPRPVYILEVTAKLPDYPYSRQLLYVDAETYHVLYKEAFDKKGELWKVMINSASEQPNVESGEDMLGWSGTVLIDVQSEHATVFHVHKARANVGLDPKLFTVSNLRKRSR